MSSKDQGPVYSSRRSLTRVNAWSYLCWVLLWPVVQAFPQEVPSLPYLSCSNVSCNSSVNTLNLDYIANLRQYVICLANI